MERNSAEVRIWTHSNGQVQLSKASGTTVPELAFCLAMAMDLLNEAELSEGDRLALQVAGRGIERVARRVRQRAGEQNDAS